MMGGGGSGCFREFLLKSKFKKNPEFNFLKISTNKWYHAKVLLKRFHLNGHTIGFPFQTQKLELH